MIIRELQDFSRSPKVNVRQVTITLLLSFCKQSKNAYQEHVDDLIRIGIMLLSDENEQVLNLAWDCVDCIIKVSRIEGVPQTSLLDFPFSRIWINWSYKSACLLFDKRFAMPNRTRENVVDWWACVCRKR